MPASHLPYADVAHPPLERWSPMVSRLRGMSMSAGEEGASEASEDMGQARGAEPDETRNEWGGRGQGKEWSDE
jgi:hypothetical protein